MRQLAIISLLSHPENQEIPDLTRNVLETSASEGDEISSYILDFMEEYGEFSGFNDGENDIDWEVLKGLILKHDPAEIPKPLIAKSEPSLRVFDGIFSPLMIAYIEMTSRPLLQPSTVRGRDPTDDRQTEVRQSEEAIWALSAGDLVYRFIAETIARQTGCSLHLTKTVAVIRYGPGDHFKPHYDEALRSTDLRPGLRRTYSFIGYLNDGFDGGETIFPKARLRITPRAGAGVIFRNFTDEGVLDPSALHGGAPVRAGEKWIWVMWFYEPWPV